jgi:hypothetical protein
MKLIASLIFGLFLASATSTYGQKWREIRPIESTCKDVERLLGGKACGQGEVEYKLPNARIVVVFSQTRCEGGWPGRYDVPPGTVISLRANFPPPNNPQLADLNIDQSKLKQGDSGDQLNILVYKSRELGVFLEVAKSGEVLTLVMFPAAEHKSLICPDADRDPPANPLSTN